MLVITFVEALQSMMTDRRMLVKEMQIVRIRQCYLRGRKRVSSAVVIDFGPLMKGEQRGDSLALSAVEVGNDSHAVRIRVGSSSTAPSCLEDA